MQCPKCHFENEEHSTECVKCRIVFAKYIEHQKTVPIREVHAEIDPEEVAELRQELNYRIFAIPAALISARVLVGIAAPFVRIIAMFVHETGHAVTAWLCGYWAIPGLWLTPVSSEREFGITVTVLLVFGLATYISWTTERRVLAVLFGIALICAIAGRQLPPGKAEMLFTFGGDGGSLVLGTLLMTTVYARRDSPICEQGLRWGFLGVGALAFIDAWNTWSGSDQNIEFGVQEGEMTDPSKLVENYGWTIQFMMKRYVQVAEVCLAVLAIIYLIGIFRARSELKSKA